MFGDIGPSPLWWVVAIVLIFLSGVAAAYFVFSERVRMFFALDKVNLVQGFYDTRLYNASEYVSLQNETDVDFGPSAIEDIRVGFHRFVDLDKDDAVKKNVVTRALLSKSGSDSKIESLREAQSLFYNIRVHNCFMIG